MREADDHERPDDTRVDDTPVLSPATFDSTAGDADIAGIVLAAGTSSRYGDKNKLVAKVDGEPIVRRVACAMTLAGVDPVFVIVGYESNIVRAAVAPIDVEIVENKLYEQGKATSIRKGIEAIRSRATPDAAVIALGDMPFVAQETIETIVDAYRTGAAGIVAAGYHGERGNPVVFDVAYFDQLASLSGDTGARRLIVEGDDTAIVETGDPGVRRDIDTQEDFLRVRKRYGSESGS